MYRKILNHRDKDMLNRWKIRQADTLLPPGNYLTPTGAGVSLVRRPKNHRFTEDDDNDMHNDPSQVAAHTLLLNNPHKKKPRPLGKRGYIRYMKNKKHNTGASFINLTKVLKSKPSMPSKNKLLDLMSLPEWRNNISKYFHSKEEVDPFIPLYYNPKDSRITDPLLRGGDLLAQQSIAKNINNLFKRKMRIKAANSVLDQKITTGKERVPQRAKNLINQYMDFGRATTSLGRKAKVRSVSDSLKKSANKYRVRTTYDNRFGKRVTRKASAIKNDIQKAKVRRSK